jgi:starch synthase
MHVAFVASECVPYSKTGGLADVVGALPRALASMGQKVSVFLPKYRQTKLETSNCLVRSITVPFDDEYRFCSILDGGVHDQVQYYFIDYPPFFDREGLYGTALGDYRDNAERFALFCRAVIEGSKILGVPDIFHCHDWQSALVPILLNSLYNDDPAFRNAATAFTIHNIGYQGLFPPDTLPLLMLPWDLFTISKLEFYGKVNLLKGALIYSDAITTVSRKYAQEVQTSEYGFGLEGVLHSRANSIVGILNGVDYEQWSPEKDAYIAERYSADSLEKKTACKRDLLAQFGGVAAAELPVIGIVSRFAAQKGFDLIANIADRLALDDVILVVLGSGDKPYEEMFRRLNRQFPKKFLVKIAYDEALAHKIEAGADMFLMPSRYEPCGLNQIYSLRYGTVPVARATGGLDDTIEPWDPITGKGTGFKFSEYSGEALLETVREAASVFKDRRAWQQLMLNGMSRDFSWAVSAREYVKAYEKIRGSRGTAQAAGVSQKQDFLLDS